jgi:hypothetical protein
VFGSLLVPPIGVAQNNRLGSHLECTREALLRNVVNLDEREDKSTVQVRRNSPRDDQICGPIVCNDLTITSHDPFVQAFSGEKA